MDRRDFLSRTGLVIAGSALTAGGGVAKAEPGVSLPIDDWEQVREQFSLSRDVVHMSAMLLSSHPRPVREAIETHRRELDANPVGYLASNNVRLTEAARAAAGHYLGVDGSSIALTDSTTMGLGLVYNGLRLGPGDEILSTEHDYYVTHEAIRLAAERAGAAVRKGTLYDRIGDVTEDEIVGRLARAITPATRVLALTWVHSSTGLKLPLRAIATMLQDTNAHRDEHERVLFCVDGVHGFGNQDVEMSDLGCDFFIAGCHKWLFGPRGTGIIAGLGPAWDMLTPSIPSFMDGRGWEAWMSGRDGPGPTTAATMSPGGFKPFEHQWAIAQAFDWHRAIGKKRVADRTAAIATQLKDGLAGMSGITLHTPRARELSAGIVSFDIEGTSPMAAVRGLRDRGVIASVAPYAKPHVRLTPSICNSPAEVDSALRAVRAVIG